MAKSKYILPRDCEICGKQFNAKTIYSKYCSKKCQDAGYRARKKEKKQEEQRRQIVEQIPENRPYISVAEAVAIFGISRDTIYRQIRKGNIPAINLGERLTRISRAHIESMFPAVDQAEAIVSNPINKPFDFNTDECYTIGEISEKFKISPSTVSKTIRRNSIPKKQIGRFVYVPKQEIDKIFSSKNQAL